MRPAQEAVTLSERRAMRDEILEGLTASRKYIPSKYFYDATGAQLFEAICDCPEYYLARAEKSLLLHVVEEVARLAGPGCVLIEPGSGNSEKVQVLLERLRPSAYVPVEICPEALYGAVSRLRGEHPWLEVIPHCGDYENEAVEVGAAGRRVVFFPGSTIGNFEPREAVRFLARLQRLAGAHGALLIGVDLKKDAAVLDAAYNDRAGITAAFNLNLLTRLNRELQADFDLKTFAHRAFYDGGLGRVEMHLVSRISQQAQVDGEVIPFTAGEMIHTENSYKYTIEQFRDIAREAGWIAKAAWVEPRYRVSVQFFVRED